VDKNGYKRQKVNKTQNMGPGDPAQGSRPNGYNIRREWERRSASIETYEAEKTQS